MTILRAMRLLGHTLSSDASIHLGGLVIKGIPASDLITHAPSLPGRRRPTQNIYISFLNAQKLKKVLTHLINL